MMYIIVIQNYGGKYCTRYMLEKITGSRLSV